MPGEPVVAVADGEVTFAGQVGGTLHVVVLHADGVRTSLSFLASIAVRAGQRVTAGDVVGHAGNGLHLGARRGEEYLDPATLLSPAAARAAPGGRVRLVPADDAHPLGADAEAVGLRRLLGVLRGPVVGALPGAVPAGWADGLRTDAADATLVLARRAHLIGAPAAWIVLAAAAQAMAPVGPCTPTGSLPRRPGGAPRRRLVLVAGLGSSSAEAAIHHVAATALGYAAADVTTYSYRGGDTATTPYGAVDTFGGVDEPARLLRSLLDRLVAANPTSPVDVVAHSMGGLVVRAALARGGPARGVGAVVTLATPHGGADLAAGAQQLLEGPTAGAWQGINALLAGTGLDVDMASRSVRQLAPGSALLASLDRAGAPAAAGPVLAVGSRTDLVVPVLRARWPGQRSVTVDVPGPPPGAHAALPGSAAATRELALVLAGAPPTCRSAADRLLDALAGLMIEVVTAKVAAGLDAGDAVLGGAGFVQTAGPR
jgi:hypothetical protein